MADNSPWRNNGGPVPKTREDDARGAPKGSFGNPPFVPTEEQRAQVRTLAKTMKHEQAMGSRLIAAKMGFSRKTLMQHFAEDMEAGRAELIASIGSVIVRAAMDATYAAKVPREQLDAIKFILPRMGGWSQKLEVSGPEGGPVTFATFDLSKLDEAAKRALLPVLDQLLENGDGDGGPNDEPA